MLTESILFDMNILTVSQLNTYVKSLLDGDRNLSAVYVRAEISNFTNHLRTGHFYLTLKDDAAAVRAVMFRSEALRLRFLPENGMRVLVRGRVSLFPRDGQYQMYIDDMQPDGAGALHIAFEQLKRKLAAEGLFDEARKKEIPRCPMRVGVITSATGAAVQDILNILGRRFPMTTVVLCPVQVQGPQAAPEIAAAVRRMNAQNAADVLIVGRGGGSVEDLWAFNEEIVARAVAESVIPVISAVGHETDFTICDFAADLRAPTPSAAAELAVPDSMEERGVLLSYRMRASRAVRERLNRERLHLEPFSRKAALRDPRLIFTPHRLRLDHMSDRADRAARTRLQTERGKLSLLCGKLDAMNPMKVLVRGYAVAEKDGTAVTDVQTLSAGDRLTLRFSRGSAACIVEQTREEPT